MIALSKRSLATVIASMLVAVTTLLVGTYFFFDYLAEAKDQTDLLVRLTNIQMTETETALALPIWNIDRAQIEKVIESMMRPKSIYAIRVTAAGKTYGRVRDQDWTLIPW